MDCWNLRTVEAFIFKLYICREEEQGRPFEVKLVLSWLSSIKILSVKEYLGARMYQLDGAKLWFVRPRDSRKKCESYGDLWNYKNESETSGNQNINH